MKFSTLIATLLCTAPCLTIAAGKVWQNPYNIGFEIRNHDNKPITVTLKHAPTMITQTADPLFYLNADDTIIWRTVVNGKRTFGSYPTLATPVDINEPLYLLIEYTNKQNQSAFAYYRFTPGKTVFVAWENQQLRPQKGKGGATQSGLSLANNVTTTDIEPYDRANNKFPSENDLVQNYVEEENIVTNE